MSQPINLHARVASAETPPKRDPRAKLRHIDACLSDEVEYFKSTGLEHWEFLNNALPEVSLQQIDLSTTFLGKRLGAPLMIAPMTGGTERGAAINRILAESAERWQIPMGVGSQRLGVEDANRAKFYRLRQVAQTTLLFANMGGAQLVRGWGASEARRAVDMVGADALFVHLNPIQEAVQGGDLDFRGLERALGQLCRSLGEDGIPVLAREVCFGMSREVCLRLRDCGVAGIDCAGAGGTSWAKVEALCARNDAGREAGERFGEWGIPTAQSISNARQACPELPLIATGGLRTGIDLAKAIALGAKLGAMARPFLLKAHEGGAAVDAFIAEILSDLRVCLFGVGAACLSDLHETLYRRQASEPACAVRGHADLRLGQTPL